MITAPARTTTTELFADGAGFRVTPTRTTTLLEVTQHPHTVATPVISVFLDRSQIERLITALIDAKADMRALR